MLSKLRERSTKKKWIEVDSKSRLISKFKNPPNLSHTLFTALHLSLRSSMTLKHWHIILYAKKRETCLW